ncbi:MAG: hypothetical protein FJ290_13985 [Planctomycetes bacterium]|nr:hypothetical protein [Planctomycetota bacterium]
MIGYPISRKELDKRITEAAPNWLQDAAKRTAGFRKKGRYGEKSPNWSVVKPVYMKLQGNCKCAYCERKLESITYGKGEQDVEHFRPKSRVRAWAMPKSLTGQGFAATPVPNADHGYYLLPYHPFNYSVACKPCNSALKSDRFPIAGQYHLKGGEPKALLKEKPYLIYPLGDFDDDPEDLIRFRGVSPQPVFASGHRRARALVTIEFFDLDNVETRKNLVRERAAIIVALYPQLETLQSGAAAAKAQAGRFVAGFTSPNSAHTNCARSYERLYAADRPKAKAAFDLAAQLIASTS